MSGTTDIVKGRIKEAAGALTDNDDLREAGKSDQELGEVKHAAQKVVDKVKDAAKETVANAQEVAEESVNRAVEKAKNVKNAIGD